MEPLTLTWHAGSVLPYASLWHTLLRVAALNSLRLEELPDADPSWMPAARRSTFSRKADLLYNEVPPQRSAAVSTAALASSLEEPPAAFEWSHLGRVPRGLRFLVHRGFRICPACAGCGYHSALLSLRLLQTCPIHGCRLVEQCFCGRRFDGFIDGAVLDEPGFCRCGGTAFFTHETCRRPTMEAGATAPMQAVAAWLERLARVTVPRLTGSGAQTEFARSWLGNLAHWCAALDLGYPSCFVEPPALAGHIVTSSSTCGIGSENTSRRRRAQRRQASSRTATAAPAHYWEDSPATWAYRGMARHLRRHVARGAECYAINFRALPDPIRIADVMRSDRAAIVAFAEMVWAQSMEPLVARHRWPHRATDHGGGGRYVGRVSLPGVPDTQGQGAELDAPGRAWVAYKACETAMRARWHQAQFMALSAVRSGLANWQRASDGDALSWALTAVVGSLRFVSLERLPGLNWTMPLPNKASRKQVWLGAQAQRAERILAACVGPCLSWTPGGDWEVKPALAPTQERVDRHRLLGLTADRPKFWLFQNSDRYVARSRDIRLQAVADTPGEAIESLRLAMRRHRCLYPPVLVERPPPLVSPQVVRDPARLKFEVALRSALRWYDFWEDAEVFYTIATDYLTERLAKGIAVPDLAPWDAPRAVGGGRAVLPQGKLATDQL